jgi:polysaccharide biosynthesis/export protein
MAFRTFLAMALLAVGLTLGGCAGPSGAGLPPLPNEVGSGSSGESAGYRLGPGDKLKVTVFGAEDLSGDFTVSEAGLLNMPLIGEVKASGVDPTRLSRTIEQKLKDGYMKDPKVSVQVATYRPIYIFGEVTRPGEYPYAAGMSLLNAVALGGGYSYRAQQNYSIVTRNGKDYRAEPTSRLLPDDIVRVPERMF